LIQIKNDIALGGQRSGKDHASKEKAFEEDMSERVSSTDLITEKAGEEKAPPVRLGSPQIQPTVTMLGNDVTAQAQPFSGLVGPTAGSQIIPGYAPGLGYSQVQGMSPQVMAYPQPTFTGTLPGFDSGIVPGGPGIGSEVVTDSASVVVPGGYVPSYGVYDSASVIVPGSYRGYGTQDSLPGIVPMVVQPPGIGSIAASNFVPTVGSAAVSPGVGSIAAAPIVGPVGTAAAQAARAGTQKAVAQNAAAVAENVAARAIVAQAAAQNAAIVADAYRPVNDAYQYYYPRAQVPYVVEPAHYHIGKDKEKRDSSKSPKEKEDSK
jgi:hypothetical protein